MAYQAARARDYLEEGLTPARLPRPPKLRLRRHVRRASTGRPWSGSRRAASTSSTASRSLSTLTKLRIVGGELCSVKVAVVGGGLAGLAAALELVDAGHEVELHEARPTLGGAVQTLPEREGDPPPPPDNGQHIGLGCFTEWLRFLGADRQGRRGPARAAAAAGDRRARAGGDDRAGPAAARLLAPAARVACPDRPCRLAPEGSDPCGGLGPDVRGRARRPAARRSTASGTSSSGRRSTCRPAEAGADYGVFTVQTALLAGARASDLLLPVEPLGEMHGAAAGRALGDRVRLDSRVESLDDLDADAVIVAVPPPEAARLLGREPRRSRTRRSSASTCSSTGRS